MKEVRLQAEAQVKKVRRGKDAQARTNDAREKLNKEKCSLEEHLLHYVFQNQRLVHQKYWSRGICTTVVGKLYPMQLCPLNVISHYFPTATPAPSYFHQTKPSKMEQQFPTEQQFPSSSGVKKSKSASSDIPTKPFPPIVYFEIPKPNSAYYFLHQSKPSKMEQPVASSSRVKYCGLFEEPDTNLVKAVIDRPETSQTMFEPVTGSSSMSSKMEQPAASSSWVKESKYGNWGFDKSNPNLVKVVIDLRPKISPTRFEPLTGSSSMSSFLNAYQEARASDPSYVRCLKNIDTNSE